MVYFTEIFLDAIKWLAVVSSIFVYFAGSKVCFDIVMKKSTGDTSLFPFIASLYSGVIWTKYGMLTNVFQIYLTSAINIVCQTVYIIIFYTYSREKRKSQHMLAISLSGLYSFLFYTKYFTFSEEEAIFKIGVVGVTMTIVMTASPLISLRQVFSDQSTATMNFWFILSNFVSSMLWLFSGFIIHDNNVIVPNMIAFLLTVFQLSLFFMYGFSSAVVTTIEKDEEVHLKEVTEVY